MSCSISLISASFKHTFGREIFVILASFWYQNNRQDLHILILYCTLGYAKNNQQDQRLTPWQFLLPVSELCAKALCFPRIYSLI
jgi:hypothetical protein